MLHYYSDLLREMIDLKTLYRKKEVQIPSPRFVVFYNGRQDQEQRRLAVIDVIDTCIKNDILADVLREHRDEVTEMYYWENNEEAHRWAIEKDAEGRG